MTASLTNTQARRIAVAAQGLHSAGATAFTPAQVLAKLGCVQIDSMSAVRRSHELVFLSRGTPRDDVLRVGTAGTSISFEGMAHALSLITWQLWPAFEFRRRRTRAHGWRGPDVDAAAVAQVRGRLEAEGQVRPSDFGRSTGTGWERDSPYRWALEWLAATGGAVCVERDRWQRVYSLPERVIPEQIRSIEMTDAECVRKLCRWSVDALGVATTKDVADYFRLRPTEAGLGLEALGLERAEVQGWREPAWLSPLAEPDAKIEDDAVTPLSPFDSLVWSRERLHRLFGKDYRLEAYKPAAKRRFGYFGMPILVGDAIVGRVALRRRGEALIVENFELDTGVPDSAIDRAVSTVVDWTGCKTTTHERIHQ